MLAGAPERSGDAGAAVGATEAAAAGEAAGGGDAAQRRTRRAGDPTQGATESSGAV